MESLWRPRPAALSRLKTEFSNEPRSYDVALPAIGPTEMSEECVEANDPRSTDDTGPGESPAEMSEERVEKDDGLGTAEEGPEKTSEEMFEILVNDRVLDVSTKDEPWFTKDMIKLFYAAHVKHLAAASNRDSTIAKTAAKTAAPSDSETQQEIVVDESRPLRRASSGSLPHTPPSPSSLRNELKWVGDKLVRVTRLQRFHPQALVCTELVSEPLPIDPEEASHGQGASRDDSRILVESDRTES